MELDVQLDKKKKKMEIYLARLICNSPWAKSDKQNHC